MDSQPAGCPTIDGFRFGQVIIDGQAHTKDVIILPDRVIAGWWRNEGHRLGIDDLDVVLAAQPEILVVGKGVFGRMTVPTETQRALEAAGIDVVAERTEKACDAYNQLAGQASVAAALHLTC